MSLYLHVYILITIQVCKHKHSAIYVCVLTQGDLVDKHAAASVPRLMKCGGMMVAGTKQVVGLVLKKEGQPPNWQCPRGHNEFDIVT